MSKYLNYKYILSFLFLFIPILIAPNISQAAVTDCYQQGGDGIANCSYAAPSYGGYKTPGEYYARWTSCSDQPSYIVCGNKTWTGTIDGRICGSYTGCANSVSNVSFSAKLITAVNFRYDTRYPGWPYSVGASQANISYVCPVGNSVVSLPSVALCKPNFINTVDLQCSNTSLSPALSNGGENKSSGMCPSQMASGGAQVADPVNIANGNYSKASGDYAYNSSWPLGFTTIINNNKQSWSNNWSYSFAYTDLTASGKIVSISLPNGAAWTYKYNGVTSLWERANNNDQNKLTANTTTGEFTYLLENNTKILFSPQNGITPENNNLWLATKMTFLGGGEYTLAYDSNNYLSTITSPHGLVLTINSTLCQSTPMPSSVVGPNSLTTSYQYNSSCAITKVTYPDLSFKDYINDTSRPFALKAIKDELGNIQSNVESVYVSISKGLQATSEGRGSTGAIDKVSLEYATNSTTVTDALSHSATINYTTINNQSKPTSYSTLCTWCQGIQGSSISYNTNGFISSVTDFNGNITEFTYDPATNLMTRAKQSVNNSLLTRQTDVTYDANWRLPATITEPSGAYVGGTYNNRVTTNTYDPTTGRLTQKSITAPLNDGTTATGTKTWKYYYDSLGQLTSIENPMYVSGVYNDKTTITYNSNGQTTSVTNGFGQTITMSSFDNYGNPQLISYPDSTSLALTYNSRGNVVGMTKHNVGNTASFATTLTRDARQLVTASTSPSGAYKEYVYDLTQRLTEIKEYNEASTYQGKTVFTLDNMSKVTKIQVLNNLGLEIRLTTKQYNNKNMLYKDLTALNYATTYTYDSNGNLLNINDANNKNLTYTYDSLNRVATQTNPDGGVITNTYNPDDSIASIVDPKSLTTSYTYNGFGETIGLSSPDTGVSTNTRNLAGDITSSTNAKSITTNYTYDVLHRPLTIDYPGTSEDVTITYDSCTNGIGKICTITDISGVTTYTYDNFARISSKNYTNGLFSKTVSYSYDSFSRLSKIIYPSGMEINYTYSNNKTVQLSYTVGGVTTNIITNGVYDPFDTSLKSYNYGDTINGVTYTNVINKDGLVSNIGTSITTNVNKAYTFDTRLNIASINGGTTPTNASATYDFNSRITNYNYGSGTNNATYNYNTSGDRTSTNINSVTNTYTTSSTSHRLDSLSGGTTDSFTYDNNGSQTASTGKTFTYNNAGRMSDYSDSTNNFSYLINSMGQRVKKIDNNNSANNVWYVYNEAGQLISEYDNSGSVINEYIYINGAPIALLRSSNLYYIYPDHLGTPRTITDTSNNPVWSWENTDPFGNNVPNDTVSGSTFIFNLRLPGQYFDNESKLNYNYFRDYNSMLGRYIQSDPIGIAGGINTFGYVGGNSLSAIDKLGLSPKDVLLIEQVFHQSVDRMIKNNLRLPGINNGGYNNTRAYTCNSTLESNWAINITKAMNFWSTCEPQEKTLEYCEGQVRELTNDIMQNLVNGNGSNKLDDGWSFSKRNNGTHFWLLAVPMNTNDPYIWLDPWRNQISKNIPISLNKDSLPLPSKGLKVY